MAKNPVAKAKQQMPSITMDGERLKKVEECRNLEWLETNGLGGFAASTVINLNTRRYHGLLCAATAPPAGRLMLVSKLDETLIEDGKKYELGINDYGEVIHPRGNDYQQSFSKGLFPEFIYRAGSITLKKTIAMKHGENTTLLIYEVLEAGHPFEMEWLPLISVRDYHSLSGANQQLNRQGEFIDGTLRIKAYENTPEFYIHIPGSEFTAQDDWYFHFNYSEEKNRGLNFEEDLFSHGKFRLTLEKGSRLCLLISTLPPAGRNAHLLFEEEKDRREKLIASVPADETLQTLALAADQFIVKRGDELKTIIAGYPWFTDWGRDTMIALPGLCLSLGRTEDAKKILAAFAQSVSEGMLPNRFLDQAGDAEYNNVDGTLWFFIAVHRYLETTGDKKFVTKAILPVLKEIIHWHVLGTRYRIHSEEDGLLYAGEPGVQLTWMDAKVGDWVVTPRIGKPVEVNALWYNALCIFSQLLELDGEKKEARRYYEMAEQLKKKFNERFWNEEQEYLYDVIGPEGEEASLRPNQLFAIGLPFPLLTGMRAKKVLRLMDEKLCTPVGLRSLGPDDPNYRKIYLGNPYERDGAYHQGTVWSWLLGIYVDAIMKTGGKNARKKAIAVVENFKPHLAEAGLGSISEIFDADPPHLPRGCFAQAWSVGECIRVILDYQLFEAPEKKKKMTASAKRGARSQKKNARELVTI